MKTTRTIPFALLALSLALAGSAHAADAGPQGGTIAALVEAGHFDPQQTVGANNPLLTRGDAGHVAASDTTIVAASDGTFAAASDTTSPSDAASMEQAPDGTDAARAPEGSISSLTQAGQFDAQQVSGANNPLLTRGDATYRGPDLSVVGTSGKTRAQVEAEYAEAVRTGNVPAPGNRGDVTMAQEFPARYAGIAAADRAAGMSSSGN